MTHLHLLESVGLGQDWLATRSETFGPTSPHRPSAKLVEVEDDRRGDLPRLRKVCRMAFSIRRPASRQLRAAQDKFARLVSLAANIAISVFPPAGRSRDTGRRNRRPTDRTAQGSRKAHSTDSWTWSLASCRPPTSSGYLRKFGGTRIGARFDLVERARGDPSTTSSSDQSRLGGYPPRRDRSRGVAPKRLHAIAASLVRLSDVGTDEAVGLRRRGGRADVVREACRGCGSAESLAARLVGDADLDLAVPNRPGRRSAGSTESTRDWSPRWR